MLNGLSVSGTRLNTVPFLFTKSRLMGPTLFVPNRSTASNTRHATRCCHDGPSRAALPGIADAAREALRQEFDRVVFLHLSVGTVAETDREIEVDELAFDGDSFSSRLVDRARR